MTPSLTIVSRKAKWAASVGWSTLLGCPFCGGPGKMLGKTDWAVAVCATCGAGGPLIEGNSQRDLPTLQRQAANKWNKRGNLTGAEARLKAIAAILNSAKQPNTELRRGEKD